MTGGVLALPSSVQAQGVLSPPPGDDAARLRRLEALVADQARRLAAQDALIRQQGEALSILRGETDAALSALRGAGAAPNAAAPIATASGGAGAPPAAGHRLAQAQVQPATPGPPAPRTVGEAPPPPEPKVQVEAIPRSAGVLTQPGTFVVEPAVEYIHASTNRLVFSGVEIVTGLQIGIINANDVDRNSVTGSVSLRYGLTDRLEIEGRIPYIHRNDRLTILAQRDETISRTQNLDASDIGDVEIAGRYQINSGAKGWPIFIGGLRYKSATGTSPFEIGYDEFGIADGLATGSGFWALEPSVSFLYPSDPVVLFGSLSYLYHAPKDVDKLLGEAFIGRVDPGDSIGASAGFGFALNPRFSFSLGYRHNYIFPTKTHIGQTLQKSNSLQVGSFTFGWSYRLTDRLSLNNAYEFGATSDAPDLRIVFRLPYRF